MKDIDRQKLPRHIAIIMDGNGRWAAQHALGRISGHKKGADAVRATVRTCRELGIGVLTLYAFSVENWLRPEEEVKALMSLLQEYLRSEIDELHKNGIRLMTIGNMDALRTDVRSALDEAVKKTALNKDMILNIALSYGGRDEIVDAIQRITRDVCANKIHVQDITKDLVSKYLYTADLPDPDLLIRTSGEYRISNFLLCQSAYTEFYFTETLWPDFRKRHLLEAISEYQRRERRFGLTSDQVREGE
ncbi:MAG: isoprenyl transferase [Syntrophales bacterium]